MKHRLKIVFFQNHLRMWQVMEGKMRERGERGKTAVGRGA
jgi:hypothetical protein